MSGRPNYQTYFDQVARLLNDDGVAVIHSIGRADGPAFTQPWIAKYIFPGGYIPALSEVLPCVERAGPDRHRHRDPAAALRRDAARPGASGSTAKRAEIAAALRRAVLPDVGVLPRRSARSPSATAATWSSSCSWPRSVDAVPITRDYIAEAEDGFGRLRPMRPLAASAA